MSEDAFVPVTGTVSDNRADELEGITRPSMGTGLVAPQEAGGYNTTIAQDMMDAIKTVVHPDTLKEWTEARLPYKLSPEDQHGINYILQTKDSKWRRITVQKMTREIRDGEEVLVAQVLEEGENLVHETVEWDHVVGMRFKSDFEHTYNGVRIVAGRPKNTRPVFLIPWDKSAAQEILRAHNNKKVRTKFYLDVEYTKFGSITEEDFLDMAYGDLHDKYLRGVTFGKTAASQKLHKKVAGLKDATLFEAAVQGDREPASFAALSAVTPNQIAELMNSGDDGKQMAMDILRQLPSGKAAEVAFGAIEALKALQMRKEQQKEKGTQNNVAIGPNGTPVDITVPLSGGTAGRVDITPSSGGGGMKPEKMPWGETTSFSKVEHDEQGNPTRKLLVDKDGKNTYIDLTPEQAATIKEEEDRLTREANERAAKEQAEIQKHRADVVGQTTTTKPVPNEGPPIEEILEEPDDDGNPHPDKRKKKKSIKTLKEGEEFTDE